MKNKKWAIVVLLLIVALACAAVCASRLMNRETGPVRASLTYDPAAVSGGWDRVDEAALEADLNEKVAEGYMNISMNTSPIFPNGTAEGNLMIVNEAVNRYPQRVVITRNDTGDTIYTSGAIPVGSKIASHSLDVDLDAGTYECTAMFQSLDPDTGAALGSAGAVITITIQN